MQWFFSGSQKPQSYQTVNFVNARRMHELAIHWQALERLDLGFSNAACEDMQSTSMCKPAAVLVLPCL